MEWLDPEAVENFLRAKFLDRQKRLEKKKRNADHKKQVKVEEEKRT